MRLSRRWGTRLWLSCAGGGAGGAGGDFLEAAEGFVDGVRVGEGVEEVGCEEDDVGAGLHAVVILAADALAEIEVWAGSERVGFSAGFRFV